MKPDMDAEMMQGGGAPEMMAGPQGGTGSGGLEPETRSDEPTGGKAPQLLSPDQQAVMHRVSEAIAMLLVDQQANRPIIEMALQGAEGVVRATSMLVGKVAESAKPGVPRELLPLAALAAVMLISDFIERMGGEPVQMGDVLPALIDKLGAQFQATPAEMQQLRRVKAKFGRAQQRGLMQRAARPEGEEPAEEDEGEGPGIMARAMNGGA